MTKTQLIEDICRNVPSDRLIAERLKIMEKMCGVATEVIQFIRMEKLAICDGANEWCTSDDVSDMLCELMKLHGKLTAITYPEGGPEEERAPYRLSCR